MLGPLDKNRWFTFVGILLLGLASLNMSWARDDGKNAEVAAERAVIAKDSLVKVLWQFAYRSRLGPIGRGLSIEGYERTVSQSLENGQRVTTESYEEVFHESRPQARFAKKKLVVDQVEGAKIHKFFVGSQPSLIIEIRGDEIRHENSAMGPKKLKTIPKEMKNARVHADGQATQWASLFEEFLQGKEIADLQGLEFDAVEPKRRQAYHYCVTSVVKSEKFSTGLGEQPAWQINIVRGAPFSMVGKPVAENFKVQMQFWLSDEGHLLRMLIKNQKSHPRRFEAVNLRDYPNWGGYRTEERSSENSSHKILLSTDVVLTQQPVDAKPCLLVVLDAEFRSRRLLHQLRATLVPAGVQVASIVVTDSSEKQWAESISSALELLLREKKVDSSQIHLVSLGPCPRGLSALFEQSPMHSWWAAFAGNSAVDPQSGAALTKPILVLGDAEFSKQLKLAAVSTASIHELPRVTDELQASEKKYRLPSGMSQDLYQALGQWYGALFR